MKKLILFLLMMAAGLCVLAQNGVDQSLKVKGEPYVQSNYPPLRSGGDTYATAVLFTTLPYTDAGLTCGATDDYSANCGCCGGSSGSPDLVYKFVPAFNTKINVSMTGFDTFLHIHDINGVELACNDDYYTLDAYIPDIQVYAWQAYYIVCEGYANICGSYTLDVSILQEIPISNWVIPIAVLLIGTVVLLRRTRVF
jgi:hypothetical protein